MSVTYSPYPLVFWLQKVNNPPDEYGPTLPFTCRMKVVYSMQDVYTLAQRDDFYWSDEVKKCWNKQVEFARKFFEDHYWV